MPVRVLVVDDDPDLRSVLRPSLAQEGYEVLEAADGPAALALAGREPLDLVLLDLALPGLGGLEVCAHLRAAGSTPILLLTAHDSVEGRVAALEHGADDFVAKPFALAELLARIKALLRRAGLSERPLLKYADLWLDRSTREAFRAGRRLPLTSRELDLLALFLSQPSRALSRDELCRRVWGYPYAGESNFVDVAIMELRKKLEADGRPRLIQTVRGFGYSLRET